MSTTIESGKQRAAEAAEKVAEPGVAAAAAAERVTVAEAEFAAAAEEMKASDRTDTQMVSDRLRKAGPELVAARTDLADLVGTPK